MQDKIKVLNNQIPKTVTRQARQKKKENQKKHDRRI